MTVSDRLFQRLVLVAVTVGFLLLTVAGGVSAWVVARNQDFFGWIEHTHGVEQKLSDLRYVIERSETARRGYMLDKDPRFVETWRQSSGRLPRLVRDVRQLTSDNPRQQARLAELSPLLDRQVERWRASIDQVDRSDRAGAARAFQNDDSAEVNRHIRRLATAMVDEEKRLLDVRREEQRSGTHLLYAVLAVSGILVLLVGFSSVWIIRNYTRDLARSREELRGLNENLEGAVADRTTDLQRANDEIQRFAYIVSHDLRSPLVNVMGFTSELSSIVPPLAAMLDRAEAEAPDIVTEDARLAVREDLPEAIGFIRSSTEKMDRLINAILRLSREGRRTISAQKVDVVALVTDIRGTMQHLLTERGVDLRIEAPMPEIISDRLALEQIFSNLIENAVKYLKPGRPGIITVRGRREGLRLIYEVEDNGRGIDVRDHERIFDLFRRSGPQDVPGEGIGLAHVRALTYRLGGVIDCDAELDRGATFHISLPAISAVTEGESK